MNKDEIKHREKTKESDTKLSNLVDSGIGIDMSSPNNKNTKETTAFPFDTPTNNYPPPIRRTSIPQTQQVIEEVISLVRTPSLSRDASALHNQQPLITLPIDISSANKSVFHDSQHKDGVMDFNNNFSNININKSYFSKAKRPILRKNKTEEMEDIILESETTPPPKPPTRSKSSHFYTISPFSTRPKSTQSNPPLGTSPLSSSYLSSTYTPSTTPPNWNSLNDNHRRRCSVELVGIAIRGASQKHLVFTPPRIDSTIDLSVIGVEVDSSIRRPLSIHNPYFGPRGLMNADVEKEVGAGLRLVSDIIHVKQTEMGHGYHLDEHPSHMHNRAYSRSYPGAPSLLGIKGDDDALLGCHGFKNKKDRESKMAYRK